MNRFNLKFAITAVALFSNVLYASAVTFSTSQSPANICPGDKVIITLTPDDGNTYTYKWTWKDKYNVSQSFSGNPLTDHPEVRYVNLALDADEQGREAAKSITEFLGDRYKVYDHPPMNGKDYNEDLLYRQEQFRAKRRSSDIER